MLCSDAQMMLKVAGILAAAVLILFGGRLVADEGRQDETRVD